MTVFFSLTILVVFPVLYVAKVNNLKFAYIMNFVTVLCFIGIHEVARELENPYFTVPNDLPLNNFHSQYNEALITMYAGFHPDAFREEDTELVNKERKEGTYKDTLLEQSEPCEEEKIEEC